MAFGRFLLPYEKVAMQKPGLPRLHPVVDRLSPAIHAQGGNWFETPVLGGYNIVSVNNVDEAMLQQVAALPSTFRFPALNLDHRMGDAGQAGVGDLLAAVEAQGYTKAELRALMSADAGGLLVLDVLQRINSRRKEFRYDAATDMLTWDGPDLPQNPLQLVAGGAPSTAILDTFTGAMSGTWSNVRLFTGQSSLAYNATNGGTVTGGSGGWCDDSWPTVFHANQEAGFTIVVLPGNTNGVNPYCRTTSLGSPVSYTFLIDQVVGTDTWKVQRTTGSGYVAIGATASSNIVAGDKCLLRCIGSDIQGWRYTGGAWSKLATGGTDATITGGGQACLEIGANTARLDDWYCGNIGTLPNEVGRMPRMSDQAFQVPLRQSYR